MLEQITLQSFRNFSELVKKIGSGLNLIIEPNGIGKSNFLEGIYFLATGHSPRTTKIQETIKWGDKKAIVRGLVNGNELLVILKPGEKLFMVNGKKVDLKRYLTYFRVVYFQPSDLNLFSGNPVNRRNFLNRLISQIDFLYLESCWSYMRLLKQRNMMLRMLSKDERLFQIIEDQISHHAVQILIKRFKVIKDLNSLFKSEDLKIIYTPSPNRLRELCEESAGKIAGYFREKLQELREKEKQLGFTLIGPQRDDFSVFIQDKLSLDGWKNVGAFGSRGQQRIATVKLKLGECELINQITKMTPVLLLDDIFSELDLDNQNLLIPRLNNGQIFITSANQQDFPAEYPQNTRISLR